jgi:Xaa-Pro aminopeptidase
VSIHARRISALRERMGTEGLAAMVVSHAANVRYLTGYVGSNGTAVVGHEGAVLLTDSRYAVSAREQVSGAEVVIGSRDLLADIAAAARTHAGEGPVGVEADTVTLGWHERFCARAEGADVRPVRGLVEDLRIIKDADEVATMRRAATVADDALGAVLAAGIVGRTERQVAFDLYAAMLDGGAEDLSFPTIVAAGPRGARPHAVPGADTIPAGTLVVIDMGAIVDGYCSDMTRTVATGPLPGRMEEIYRVCLDAQLAALAAARPGITGGDLDAVARDAIAAAGHGDHFGHGLGHGVGLEIHEAPGVRPGVERVLEAGMAITIEPGIYIEGLAGVRIEDLVILTGDGYDIISATPKDLTVVA